MKQVKTTCSNMAEKEAEGMEFTSWFAKYKESDSTYIPNIVLDVVMSQVTASEFKVVSYLARVSVTKASLDNTPQYDDFAISQLERGTGMAHSTVIVALNSLTSQKIVVKHEGGQEGRLWPVYSYNSADTEWEFTLPVNRQTQN